MEDRNDNKQGFFRVGTPRCGLITGLLGAAIALMLIFLGFWKTLLLFVLVGIAFFIGTLLDEGGRARVGEFFRSLFKSRE